MGRALARATVAHAHTCSWIHFMNTATPMATLMRTTFRNCDSVICLGRAFAADLQRYLGKPCIPIPNGVSAPAIPSAFLPELREPIRILFLSNFGPQKGLRIAADALRLLVKQGVHAELFCAGEWQDESAERLFHAEFHAEIEQHSIRLIGSVSGDAKHRALAQAHFLVLPVSNPHEGQPLVLIEAMSYGVPPITTRCGAIPDLFDFDAGTRLACDTHLTSEGIAQTIHTLAIDADSYSTVTAKCRHHFLERLQIDSCVGEILLALERATMTKAS